MRTLDLDPHGELRVTRRPDTVTFAFPLSLTDRQADAVYLDRPGEVHVNLALGRLCAIGCEECSATIQSRQLVMPLRGNLSPVAVGQKVRRIVAALAADLQERRLVISAMNDGDPLSRSLEEIEDLVTVIVQTCAQEGVVLDRLNLSSAIIPMRASLLHQLAQRYADSFGPQLVQWQGSLLATRVKQNIFAGDQRDLDVMIAALGAYRAAMRAATGRGNVWINYVAVKRGDFGRADSADRLATVARVADRIMQVDRSVQLKITRGTVEGLAGWQQLEDDEYTAFVAAVRRRWGDQLSLHCPDEQRAAEASLRCGRLQALGSE